VAQGNVDFANTARTPVWKSTWDGDRKLSSALMGPNHRAFNLNRANDDLSDYTNGFGPTARFSNPGEDDIFVDILDDNAIEGDEFANLKLTDPACTLILGGIPIPVGLALGTRAEAMLTIVDNDFNFGTLGFSAPTYSVGENAGRALITVTRVGGVTGNLTVQYTTSDGTAKARERYLATAGTLNFAPGQTSNSFFVPILNDSRAQLDQTVILTLFNPGGYTTNVPPNQRLDPNRTNAVLTIIDDDFAPGRVSFESATFSVTESEPLITIRVKRTGGSVGDLVVRYATSDGSAKAGQNYTMTVGTLHWVDGDTAIKTFTIPILDDNLIGADRTANLTLFDPTVNGQPNPDALGNQASAAFAILNDDAYGSLAFSQPTYFVDETSAYAIIHVIRVGGSAGTVSVDFLATNLTAVVGANFQATNGTLILAPGETSRSFIVPILDDLILAGNKTVRLSLSNPLQGLPNFVPGTLVSPSSATLTIIDRQMANIPAGSFDPAFTAEGTDKFIYSMALQGDGSLLIGGDFRYVNGINRNRMARLNPDGALDRIFDPLDGPNGSVRSVVIQNDGRILIGGLFTSISQTNRNYLARLNVEGSLDLTFNPGAGPDNPVYAIATQSNGKIVIGGDFAMVNGVPLNHLARLSTNGLVDVTFDPGTGANGTVYALAMQSDGKIVVGGDFTMINGFSRNCIARLNPNGSVDTSFDPGTGANAPVRAIVIQSDGRILIGGLFNSVNGSPLASIARLKANGSLDADFTPGSGADNAVYAIALQIDGRILLGGDFAHFNGVNRSRIARLNPDGSIDPTINFGEGANGFVSALVAQPDGKIILSGGFTLFDGVPRNYLARIYGGSMAGSGKLEYSSPLFWANETETNAIIKVRRTGGTTGAVSVDYAIQPGGTAKADADFVSTTGTLRFPSGEIMQTFSIPIINDTVVELDETVNLVLANFVGAGIGNQPTARLVIASDDSLLGFSSPAYNVNENTVTMNAMITVTRSGSILGTVSVNYVTMPGTAVPGQNYLSTSGALTFGPGETNKSFTVSVLNNTLVEGNRTVNLLLSSPTAGGVLDRATSVLTIVDDDFAPGMLNFSSPTSWVDENGTNATITVVRTNGITGIVLVSYATRNGSAIAGLDYVGTNGVLVFADGETSKSFSIRITDDLVPEDDETLEVYLFSPTGGATLGTQTNAVVSIINNNYIYGNFVFGASQFQAQEGATNATIAVLRKNGTAGQVAVEYTTSDGTATNGADYKGASGTLYFGNGETNKTFTIPILEDNLVEGNETVQLTLVNPAGNATLGRPRLATLTIIDNDLTFSFGADQYTAKEDEGSVTVTVKRSAGGPATLAVDYATTNGTAIAGLDYVEVKGTLTFGIGELTKTFTVPIINDTSIENNETIYLTLSNPAVGALLGVPSTATITIMDEDGSLIVPAGSALTEESISPANGAIDPGETVTLNFAIQNIGKQDTTNLLAALLATNGVAAPSAPQNFGVLTAGGLLAARPFTFTARGTNGETITPTFELQDNGRPLGKVTFTYTLGSSQLTFSNTKPITIPDQGPTVPYPSTIAISGIVGAVSKITVTLDRLSHSYPADIDILLASPGGQGVLLMSDAGGDTAITNITLTFDDLAPAGLPSKNPIVSGLYKPTNFNAGDSFTNPAPAGPYGESLSVFNGINPNGTWSLYVVDDTRLDSGHIAGGWSMTITTVKDLNLTADLALAMDSLPQTVLLGNNLTYTITVANHGPKTATAVIVTNPIPAGLRLVSATASQGSFVQVDDQLIYNFLLLTNGAQASATVQVTATAIGAITNFARVKANEADLNPINNIAQSLVTVLYPAPPRAERGLVLPDKTFQLTISGLPNQDFIIEASTDLIAWTPISTNKCLADGNFTFVDANAPTFDHRFYRLKQGN
jgi:uncharacterized repeat protein (TIGR01451 family)/uncharacterized delta-60 repeat protein